MQTDPIGYEDQMNLYAYVGNDPMNHTDPLGLNNCEVVPGGTKDCIGNDDAKPDSEEENKKKEVIDEIVVKGKRTKGGNPNLYRAVRRPGEIGFAIVSNNLVGVGTTETKVLTCSDGSKVEKNVLNRSGFDGASAGGHTHGTNIRPGPGPDDGQMAATLGIPAYVVYRSGVAVVESVGGSFRARLVQGRWGASRRSIENLVNGWNKSGDGTTTVDKGCK